MGQKVVTMEQKLAAVFAAGQSGSVSVTQVCADNNISRQTYYRYRRRFQAEGLVGLVARSRAPQRRPTQTGEAMVELIIQARKQLEVEGWDNGAISIRSRLLFDGLADPPAARTVHRVLVRAGMVEPDPKKRPRSSYRRFVFPATDDCWQIDAFEVTLADPASSVVVVFQLLDDYSRYDVADLAWPQETTEGAWTCATTAIQRYGLPKMLLSDNGLAFTGNRLGTEVLFERNLAAVGVRTIHSRPFHPQTNGKNERSHQTLQRWLRAQPPATTLAELQTLLDRYRGLYNRRPHQGLDGATPLERRAQGRRTTPQPALNPTPPTFTTTATVDNRGNINFRGMRVPLGVEYADATTTAFLTGNQLLVFYREFLLYNATIDPHHRIQASAHPTRGPRRRRIDQPQPNPLSPMS
jgi:transposase InsO family protein